MHGRHVCLVFEVYLLLVIRAEGAQLLGPNLLSLIKATHYKGIELPVVQVIARQVPSHHSIVCCVLCSLPGCRC